jgi:hypothetical protein
MRGTSGQHIRGKVTMLVKQKCLTGKDVLLVRHRIYERWWRGLHGNILLGELQVHPSQREVDE